MTKKCQWIWYPGDFEIYHALQLNCRREERDIKWPAFWRLDDCWHNVRFRKTATLTQSETIEVYSQGIGYVLAGGIKHPYDTPIKLEPGTHSLEITCAKLGGLPSIYVTGDAFASGADWEADHLVSKWVPVGCNNMYTDPADNPEQFKFSYEPLEPASREELENGVLYDFGKETFAELQFDDVTPGPAFGVFYGESRTEALDTKFSYLRSAVPEDATEFTIHPRAFRYIFVEKTSRDYQLRANYEYLPLKSHGQFRCSDERMNAIWDVSRYTFHLNSREFFLDGIKRDRWVWSGDAYQSYLVNYYLFFNQEIVKRTAFALRGKDPVEQHINTILDYSLFWIIGIGDYYRHTGDQAFVRLIWERLESMLEFCLSRRNENGFIVGQDHDWVFIDWADIDKTGAVCAEQFLLLKALDTASNLSETLSLDRSDYRDLASQLREDIDRFFWDEKQQAYIDSHESGKNNITRHANILAILFDYVDETRRSSIVESVIQNDKIPPIKTPYFKFYELEALCSVGLVDSAYDAMRTYWGAMLDLGATSIWEEFDPTVEGDAHYAMYGDKYGKSLCHAWGASPIYLLGKYFLGVRPTSDGYQTFECRPTLGQLEWIEGTVPINDGSVTVKLKDGQLEVWTDRPGGTLIWNGQTYPIAVGESLVL